MAAKLLSTIVACLFLGVAIFAIFAIRSEAQISAIRAQVEADPDASVPAKADPDNLSDQLGAADSPRALVARALVLTRRAERIGQVSVRGAMLDRAAADLDLAAPRRAHWGGAWAVRAYVETLRSDGRSGVAIAALARSYRDTPFLRQEGAWRVGYAFDHWAAMPGSVQQSAVEEALWLYRIDSGARSPILGLARETDAYGSFMRRWRELHQAASDRAD